MKIKLIAAIGKNNELGYKNKLIWNLPNDLKFFKEQTMNKTIIMGYNTYKSLPKKLKDRKNIVLYENKIEEDGVIFYSDVYELLKNLDEEEVFVIGGASIYNLFIDMADELYITHIDASDKADCYFPKIDLNIWKRNKVLGKNVDNDIKYEHVKYTRKKEITKGKLILIEGTDCSGKESQTTMLVDKLHKDGIMASRLSFPMYDSPTGKIIGACLLGKEYLCNSLFKDGIKGWFPEGGGNIDPLAAIDFYAADRRYNMPKITRLLDRGINVILDRYVDSNMAHRGGMIKNKKERLLMYDTIRQKEYVINKLPYPDKTYLLYMPYDYALILKNKRKETLDETETNEVYLKNGEKAYLELAKIYGYDIIKCVKKNEIRTIENINEELYKKVLIELNTIEGDGKNDKSICNS